MNKWSRLAVFANSKAMEDYIGRELKEKLQNPLVFQLPGAAAASPISARCIFGGPPSKTCSKSLTAKSGARQW